MYSTKVVLNILITCLLSLHFYETLIPPFREDPVCRARDTESYDKQHTDGSHARLALLLSNKTFFSDSASQCNYLLWLHTHKYFIEDNKVVLGNVFTEMTFLIFGEW